MLEFHQKETFATNFPKDKVELYKKAIDLFMNTTDIQAWIEEEAFDALGHQVEESFSLHTNQNFKGKVKWLKFFINVDTVALIEGRLPKQNIFEKVFSPFIKLK